MIFIPIAAIALFILFGWCFAVNSISLSLKNARLCRLCLLCAGSLGIVFCVLSAILFAVTLTRTDADFTVKAVVYDSYIMFVGTSGVFFAVGFVITLISSLLKTKLCTVIPIVSPLWAVIGLFWTYMCAVWSDFAQFDASSFVILFGIGEALLLSFPPLIQTGARVKLLSDGRKIAEIEADRRRKKAEIEKKRAAKKQLSEKKKKLKHPKK